MRRRVIALVVVGVVLVAAAASFLGAFSGDDNPVERVRDLVVPQTYCDALAEDQEIFADDGSGVGILKQLDALEDLAAKAPDDLTDEWQTALAALEGLGDALDAAGVKPEDYVGGEPPASLDAADRAAIAAAASQVAAPAVVDAFSGIDQQAKDVCKLQLGL